MTHPRHIVFVLPDLRFGGGQRVILALARRFVALGLRVDIVNLAGDGELIEEVPLGVRHVPLATSSKYSKWRLALTVVPKLAAFLRREKPDAILSSMTGANLATMLACSICAFQGRVVLREAASTTNAKPSVLRLVRVLYRRANAIVAVSKGVADDLRAQRLPNARLVVIPNPVDVERLRARAQEPSVLPDAPYLVSVGRMTPQKDHATLLKAYVMSRARTSHRLVIVGDGPEAAQLRELAIRLCVGPRVDFTGALANPFPMIAGASLFVLSSRWEGYPNVLLEALALDVPVVSTDCPAGPSELLDAGRYGVLVPVGDIERLAGAIDLAIARPAPATQAVVDSHRPDLIAQRYLQVLEGDP